MKRMIVCLCLALLLTACVPLAAPAPAPAAVSATPRPTGTRPPTHTATLTPTPTPTLTTLPTKTSLPSVTPTNTKRDDDHAEVNIISPQTGALFAPGESFNIVLDITNTGESSWSPGYGLYWAAGPKLGMGDDTFTLASLGHQTNILPKKMVKLRLPPATAPQEPGLYRSRWYLANYAHEIFLMITIEFEVK